MKTIFLSVAVLALAAPMAFGQQQGQQHVSADAMNNTSNAGWGNHEAWMKSIANLDKLRAQLTEAWKGMGMPAPAAKLVADAYDPEQAARIHPVSLRGKSDQEAAQIMQQALKEKRYLQADLLLIEYQRQQVKRSQ